MNVLGFAVIAIGALLSFIGFDRISDIDNKLRSMVDAAIVTHVADASTTLEELKKKNHEVESRLKDLDDAKSRWEKIESAIDNLEGYEADTDVTGIWRDFQHEYQASAQSEDWLAQNRQRAVNVVLQVTAHIEQSAKAHDDVAMQITPNDLFNVAQLGKALGRADLRRKLVDAAYEAEQTAATIALHLQSRATSDDDSFESLIGMVEDLRPDNPQIVVAEAWNAVERRSDYSTLIDAIDGLIKKHGDHSGTFLPSYAIAVKAEAHLRRGLPQDTDRAVAAYARAVKRLQLESPNSQWASETISSVLGGIPLLRSFGADMAELDEAISSSRIARLNSTEEVERQLERLGQLFLDLEANNVQE